MNEEENGEWKVKLKQSKNLKKVISRKKCQRTYRENIKKYRKRDERKNRRAAMKNCIKIQKLKKVICKI